MSIIKFKRHPFFIFVFVLVMFKTACLKFGKHCKFTVKDIILSVLKLAVSYINLRPQLIMSSHKSGKL